MENRPQITQHFRILINPKKALFRVSFVGVAPAALFVLNI